MSDPALPVPVPDPSSPAEPSDWDQVSVPPGSLWAQIKADPQYAPEHLALEAVRRLGPEAQRWAERTRDERPRITADRLAELAVWRFVNFARLSGAVSGATGLPGAIIDVGRLAWTRSRMALHIAAAHGLDPTSQDRATDLLVLQRVHKAAETARLALGVAAGRERASRLFAPAGGQPPSGVILKLGGKLAQMAGVSAAQRVFAKMVPGAGMVLGSWVNAAATKELARRARTLYRASGS